MNRTVLALISVASLAQPVVTLAQADRPSVSVATFEADRGIKLSRGDAATLADDLAARFLESGRYRVLEREWLRVPSSRSDRVPVPALRAAAHAAGVDYLIVATVTGTSNTGNADRRLLLAMAAGSFLSRRPGPLLLTCRPAASRQPFLSVRLQAIDAATGAIARETASRRQSVSNGARVPAGCGYGTATLTTAMAATAPSRLDVLRRLNAEVASALVLPMPAARTLAQPGQSDLETDNP